MNEQPLLVNGGGRIYRLDGGSYVAADAGGWLPGVFGSEADARKALAADPVAAHHDDLARDAAQLWSTRNDLATEVRGCLVPVGFTKVMAA